MIPMGSNAMRMFSRMLLIGFGFSKGWVELALNQPPPLVPRCLIEVSAATGPRVIVCCPCEVADGVASGAGAVDWSSVVVAAGAVDWSLVVAAAEAVNGPFNVLTCNAPSKVAGTPSPTNTIAHTNEIGSMMRVI